MNWLAPNFLFGLLALALPLALHLLRRRVVRTVPFPALRFLAPNRADQRKHNLRRRVILALRCLALALLAFAFARPFFGTPPAATARATVVVIDNSFSMQTGSRWTELLRWTRRQVGTPSRGDTLGLLLMNPRPTWLVAPTQDLPTALASLDTLDPGWETTRAEPALRLAADVLAATPARDRRIVFLGDHQALGWTGADFTKKLPPGVGVFFPEAQPAPVRQAALTSVAFTREGDAWVATVTARNFTAAHSRTLSVFAENATTPLLTTTLALPVNDALTVKLLLPAGLAAAPAFIRASLDADDLGADDTAWAVVPAARGERLLLLDHAPAAATADYVSTAYTALASLPPSLRIAPVPGVAWPVPAAAILRNDASFTGDAAARLDTFLKNGGSALVFIDGGSEQLHWLSTHGIVAAPALRSLGEGGRIRDWTLDHPLVAPLAERNLRSLVGWEFARAWSLPADAVEPLALWADGSVALGELRTGAGRVLVAGFSADRRDGDWPVQPAFVPFLHRAATYLLGLAATAAEAPPRVGTPIELPSTPGTWRALAGPAAANPPVTLSGTVTPAAPGVYEFAASGSPRRLYAVGLAPEESDVASWRDGTPWLNLVSAEKPRDHSLDTRIVAANADSEKQSPLWWWAFAAMALFALAELSLANRTAR